MSALIRWYGGKGVIARRILPYIPAGGKPYCEPLAGGLAILLAREPAPVEVVNDLDGRIVHFYRTLQDEAKYQRLRHMLEWTPYARSEFARALDVLARWDETEDDVLKAWAVYVAHNFAMSASPRTVGTFGIAMRVNVALAYYNRVNKLDAFRARLARVVIEHDDALRCIARWDTPETVFYLDPPYHSDTRKSKRKYAVEADHALHEQLVTLLLSVKGAVALSCYWHPVYQPLINAGWARVDFPTVCRAAASTRASGLRGAGAVKAKMPRVETLLINSRAQQMLSLQRGGDDRW
ncbi:MAG: DNA adenine methylase [Thermoflexales bacterium]|nr:DNA adenine methylase [Thermoflexales bacterium]